MSEKKVNLEQQLKELEEIVASFEQGDIDIETAITQFKKGAELAESIKQRLGELENNITVLKQRFDQES